MISFLELDFESRVKLYLSSKRCNKCFSSLSKECSYEIRIGDDDIFTFATERKFFSLNQKPDFIRPLSFDYRFPFNSKENKSNDFARIIWRRTVNRKSGNIIAIILICSKCEYELTLETNLDTF